jgi:hypothetical protein
MLVGCHITHNGDFDALEAYSSSVPVDDVGLWLERILHVPNHNKGVWLTLENHSIYDS